MDVLTEVEAAEARINEYLEPTPVIQSPELGGLGGATVSCKLENLQPTASFKVRGALNKVLSLPAGALDRGVVTASTGNHGAAVAYALGQLGARGVVYVPDDTPPDKVIAIERLGAQVERFGDDCILTEEYARRVADERGMPYISPYNDPQIVAGQGTIALELVRQLDSFDVVMASVGGGGLIGGIGGYLKALRPEVEIIGCSPANSAVMAASVEEGRILELPSAPTLSVGTAGGVEPGAITFGLCRDHVDRFVTVSEAEIARSLGLFIDAHHMLIEGAAAVTVASYLKLSEHLAGRSVVLVICGANINTTMLKDALTGV